jgi:uncharacterized coiled-coil protein SlyX
MNYSNLTAAVDNIIELNKRLTAVTKQRDRLAEALRELCKALMTANPRDITELLNKAGDALQSLTKPNEL